jgi:uncharacterized protein YhjY with autotransporter beta-barrel domain
MTAQVNVLKSWTRITMTHQFDQNIYKALTTYHAVILT